MNEEKETLNAQTSFLKAELHESKPLIIRIKIQWKSSVELQ